MGHQLWTEQQLLAGIRTDDQRVIQFFCYELQSRAQRVLCRQVMPGSRDAVAFEECFSKAVLTIIQKVRDGDYQDRNFWAFAIGVVKYSYREALRKMRRHQWSDLEEAPEIPDPTLPPATTAQEVFERLDHAFLYRWFEQLNDAEKVLLDYRIQGYQHDEIAPMMSLAAGTVRNRYAGLVRAAKCIVGDGRRSAA